MYCNINLAAHTHKHTSSQQHFDELLDPLGPASEESTGRKYQHQAVRPARNEIIWDDRKTEAHGL